MDEQQICGELVDYHKMLPREGLVTWTSGNISYFSSELGKVFIKPSGVKYEELDDQSMVAVDLDGNVISGGSPSTDVWTHLYVYRNCVGIQAIVHTHSRYATSFAALGWEIPCVLTAVADEFGGPVPCGNYATIGDDSIGRELVRLWKKHGCLAMLMKSHGVFTVGPSIDVAVKAAVMVEDTARTIWSAMLMGTMPAPLPDDEIARLHDRYVKKYGQK